MSITQPKYLIGRNKSPTKLDGSFWVITCYFNPECYNSRLENFVKFYSRLLETNVNVKVLELAYGSAKFVLQDFVQNDNLIQKVYGGHIFIWQKERLLNILLNELPEDCDKVCWMDADILVQNDDWVLSTSLALQDYKIVQPFSWCALLPRGIVDVYEIDIDCFPVKYDDCSRVYSYIYGLLNLKNTSGHPGFMWAARKSLLDKHKLYDKCIDGGGDWLISRAATWQHYNESLISMHGRFLIADYIKWAQPFCESINFSFNYVPNIIFHQYHGKVEDRRYVESHKLLKKMDFNPNIDLEEHNGMLVLSEHGQRFKYHFQKYFAERKES